MPRGLTWLGMVGGPLQSVVGIFVVFGVFDAGAGVQGILTIPEIIWELSLGIYPLIWGFRSSPILSEEGRVVLQPALEAR